MSLQFQKADVRFNVNDKPIRFIVIHNLPKMRGMRFEDALDNWLARTNTFTAYSLCKYIMSKDESFVAMTEKQYKRLNS